MATGEPEQAVTAATAPATAARSHPRLKPIPSSAPHFVHYQPRILPDIARLGVGIWIVLTTKLPTSDANQVSGG